MDERLYTEGIFFIDTAIWMSNIVSQYNKQNMVNIKERKAKKKAAAKKYSYDVEIVEESVKFLPFIKKNKKVIFHRRKLQEGRGMQLIMPKGWTKEEIIHE